MRRRITPFWSDIIISVIIFFALQTGRVLGRYDILTQVLLNRPPKLTELFLDTPRELAELILDTSAEPTELILDAPTELFLDTPTELFPDTPTELFPDTSYTENDIELLCKMVYGEARGCAEEEQALTVWTVLNRLDDGRFGNTIEYIITAPRQFIGYNEAHPVTDDIRTVVETALKAWAAGDDAPTCPPYAETSDYLYFSGSGRHNYFK